MSNLSPWDAGAITLAKAGMDPTQFAIVANICASLAANQSCTFGVAFAPTTIGAKTAAIAIVPATAGSVNVDVSGTASGPLTVVPAMQDFGTVIAGLASNSVTFTFSNPNVAATPALAVGLGGARPDGFAITADGCTAQSLAHGASCTVATRFAPAPTGPYAATLGVTGSTAVSLIGTALGNEGFALSPSPFDFGSSTVGASSPTQTFTATNTGGLASGAASVSLGGTDPGDFTIASTTCTGAIAPGGTCTIAVQFTPVAVGSRTAILALVVAVGGTASAGLLGAGQ